jgi:pyruvate dehydrogenase E1 component
MVPFYIYYSMFGFQRVGDLIWAAGDAQARGFLLGGTAGRTTLNGEGLQHQDGHSHLAASTIPNCIAYDPAYAYELAVIVQDGLRRMYAENENVFYYVTVMNENYHQPAMPEGAADGIIKGMHLLDKGHTRRKLRARLLGSGSILREVIAAAELLEQEFGVSAEVWSVTSFTELRREALDVERWNRLHPTRKPRVSYVEKCLSAGKGPVIAATDYMKVHADQIRAFIPAPYTCLGTDGYGRSDTREQLRHFFEVDRHHVVVATLKALADAGDIAAGKVGEALRKYGIDPDKPNPVTV